jgi:hypothetical protein
MSGRISFRRAVIGLGLCLSLTAQAQLGSGWIATSFTKRIHLDDEAGLQTFTWTSSKSVCSNSVCADYTYDSNTDTETFRIFDGRSNRSEIRLQNEYLTGARQFEGYVTFYPPLEDESLFQIFGSTSGATLCMMRGYSANGGKLRVVGGIGDLVTGVYGVEKRINVIHIQDAAGSGYVQFYVDGVFKGQFNESEVVDTYWKYGCYGTTAGNVPAIVEWRAVRTFRDGLPPGVVATPPGALEAEDAVLSGAVVANGQPGYTGTGFADYINATADYVQWIVSAPVAGLYDLKFRYALASGNRPLQIQINGQEVVAALDFPATGNWTNWAYVTIPSQPLPAGTNTVRATAIGANGPNLDHLLPVSLGGLVARLTFDHDTASDSSGYGNHGTLLNGASIITDATRGKVLLLDGVNDCVDLGNGASLNLSDNNQATVAAWVKLAVSQNHNTILSKGEWKEAYALVVKGDTTPDDQLWTGNDTSVLSGAGVPLNIWTHVAMVISNDLTTFYLNGQVSGAANQDRGNALDNTATGVSIGREQYSGSLPAGRWFFNGQLDDVRIYERVLSQAEIQSVMVGPPPITQPRIAGVTMNGPDLVLSGTNGVPGGTYYVLSSTNVALPLLNWTRAATNVFAADGSFSLTNPAVANAPQQFYLLHLAP